MSTKSIKQLKQDDIPPPPPILIKLGIHKLCQVFKCCFSCNLKILGLNFDRFNVFIYYYYKFIYAS